MKYLEHAKEVKDENMRRIANLVFRARRGIVDKSFQKPIYVEPRMHLEILTHVGDDVMCDRCGYVIDIDPKTFKPDGAEKNPNATDMQALLCGLTRSEYLSMTLES